MSFDTWFYELQTRLAQQPGAGLPAWKALLERLGNPQNNYKIIHVAGTNGKGTVTVLLAHTFSCAGYKTGLFISPHLVSPTERIQLMGQPISEKDFQKVVQTVQAQEIETLNFFELITAAAFVYFREKNAEYVILETGLGGRKDPTNVCSPVLSIITSIGLDHTHLLGSTWHEIAVEKAGIIKPGVPVCCGPVPIQAAHVIEQTVLDNHSPLTWVEEGNPFYTYAYDFVNGFTILHTTDHQEWYLHLLGEHQVQNACLVYQAAQQLGVAENCIKMAFETLQLPGRFEQVCHGKTTFILDGAHNPPAMESLLEFWKKTPYAFEKPALLCGFMKDKDFKSMFNALMPYFERVIVTVPPSPRAATQKELGSLLQVPHVTFEPDYKAAVQLAKQEAVVLCTGSFYLVGSIYAELKMHE